MWLANARVKRLFRGDGEVTRRLEDLAADAGAALRARQQSLATAESCTGGMVAAALTSVSGSSAWFMAGWVTYSNAAKQRDLGVPAYLIETHGAVSAEVVEAMALGARSRAGTDWSLAVSGIAGPGGGTPFKPVGTVWLAWAGPNGVVSEHHLFAGDRAAVRHAAVETLLAGLLARLG